MFVIKRDGKKEPIMFDKITARIKKLCYGFNDLVDPVSGEITIMILMKLQRFTVLNTQFLQLKECLFFIPISL